MSNDRMSKPADSLQSLAALPAAVRWYEGMALLPQHFQQLAMRAEMLAASLLRARDPLHWGVLRLGLEQDGSHLTLAALEAVMPDGLPVVVGREDRLGLDLSAHEPDAQGVWRVALAVAAQDGSRRPDPPRYLEQGSVRVADQNPGGPDEVISVLRPNLQLVCGQGQGYADAELLPLARYRRANGLPQDAGYIAPWLRIAPPLGLHGRVQALVRRLRAAYAQLAADPFDPARPPARRALLPSLGALALELDAASQAGSHPRALYDILVRLLGALAAGTGSAALPPLPGFDYRALADSFDPLLAQLDALHAQLAPDYDWMPFRSLGKQEFEIAPNQLAGAAPYVVALLKPVRASDEDMRRWFDEALICSIGRNVRPEHQRMRGIGKAPLSPEAARRVGGDASRVLFQLQVDGAAADYFDPATPLRISGPGGSADGYVEPLGIELLLRPAASFTTTAAGG